MSDQQVAGLIVVWLIVSPFIGMLTPAPLLVVGAPFILGFVLVALLEIGTSLCRRWRR